MIERFKVGETYGERSICDHNCVFSAKVVNRTKKTVTFYEPSRGLYKCRPHIWDGAEAVYPYGRYSMCTVFSADRTLARVLASR